jgi:hypothetical protein
MTVSQPLTASTHLSAAMFSGSVHHCLSVTASPRG